jgi:hypothetical protein
MELLAVYRQLIASKHRSTEDLLPFWVEEVEKVELLFWVCRHKAVMVDLETAVAGRRMSLVLGRQRSVMETELDMMVKWEAELLAERVVMAVGFVVVLLDLVFKSVAAVAVVVVAERVERLLLLVDQLERHTERVVAEAV